MKRYIILPPCAMGYYALVGAMSNIQDFEEISGCSAGAMLGLFLCVGKTMEDIIKFSFSLNMPDFIKPTLKDFIKTYGFIQYDVIRTRVLEFIGCNPTFRDLKKKLYISAYCVNKLETHYFSVDTHPDMHVIDAVCMSTAIPFLFSSFLHDGCVYIDGGMFESSPYVPFLNRHPDEVLTVEVVDSSQTTVNSLYDFVLALVAGFLKKRHRSSAHTVTVEVPPTINLVNFFMSYEDKIQLFLLGKNINGPM